MKPRLLRSELTGQVYVVTRYKVDQSGLIQAQTKYDVTDEFNALSERPSYKPGWHTTHACISCSPDGVTPGPGCLNCRNTGYDQMPCPSCPALTDGNEAADSRALGALSGTTDAHTQDSTS